MNALKAYGIISVISFLFHNIASILTYFALSPKIVEGNPVTVFFIEKFGLFNGLFIVQNILVLGIITFPYLLYRLFKLTRSIEVSRIVIIVTSMIFNLMTLGDVLNDSYWFIKIMHF